MQLLKWGQSVWKFPGKSKSWWISEIHTCTRISPYHKAHEALTISFHPLQFAVRALTVAHDCYPTTCLSSEICTIVLLTEKPGNPGGGGGGGSNGTEIPSKKF